MTRPDWVHRLERALNGSFHLRTSKGQAEDVALDGAANDVCNLLAQSCGPALPLEVSNAQVRQVIAHWQNERLS